VRTTGRMLPIGTVAERYGVPATTLRYWEQAGLLPAQERAGGRCEGGRGGVVHRKKIR